MGAAASTTPISGTTARIPGFRHLALHEARQEGIQRFASDQRISCRLAAMTAIPRTKPVVALASSPCSRAAGISSSTEM
jgi:hypothetical protein